MHYVVTPEGEVVGRGEVGPQPKAKPGSAGAGQGSALLPCAIPALSRPYSRRYAPLQHASVCSTRLRPHIDDGVAADRSASAASSAALAISAAALRWKLVVRAPSGALLPPPPPPVTAAELSPARSWAGSSAAAPGRSAASSAAAFL